MGHTRSWQNFLICEGGIKSAKTEARLTPEIVIRAIDVYKRVVADFNNWLKTKGELPIRAVQPVGSVSYAQRDLQDRSEVIYGDVDYLVEFPIPPSAAEEYTETRKVENSTKRKYRGLFTAFLSSPAVTPEIDVDETLKDGGDPMMVILEAHPGVLVQVDTVITFPDYSEWMATRYTPQRGLKGYTMGKLYKALGDVFPVTIGTEGIIARTKDGRLVTGRMRKGVELRIISKNPKSFLIDLARYITKDENLSIHSDLSTHGGMTGEITLRKLAQGIRGLALTLETGGFMSAQDMLAKILSNYEEGLEEHRVRTTKRIENKISQLQDSSQRDKLEKKIKEIDEINAKALKAVSPALRV
jgi:hypothetical protein